MPRQWYIKQAVGFDCPTGLQDNSESGKLDSSRFQPVSAVSSQIQAKDGQPTTAMKLQRQTQDPSLDCTVAGHPNLLEILQTRRRYRTSIASTIFVFFRKPTGTNVWAVRCACLHVPPERERERQREKISSSSVHAVLCVCECVCVCVCVCVCTYACSVCACTVLYLKKRHMTVSLLKSLMVQGGRDSLCAFVLPHLHAFGCLLCLRAHGRCLHSNAQTVSWYLSERFSMILP